jgi:hypothetical protein
VTQVQTFHSLLHPRWWRNPIRWWRMRHFRADVRSERERLTPTQREIADAILAEEERAFLLGPDR